MTSSIYHFSNDGAVTVLAGQLAILQVVFQLNTFETGVLIGTALFISAAAQLAIGVLSDRLDPSTTLVCGLAVLGIASILVSFSTGFMTLLVTVAAARIGASFYHPVGFAWIGQTFRKGSIDRPMGIQSSFGDAGVILGLATGAALGARFGWGTPFVLWGTINLAAAIGGFALGPRGKPEASPGPRVCRSEIRRTYNAVRAWLVPIAAGYACYTILAYFGPLLLYGRFGLSVTASGVAIALWILLGAIGSFFFGRMSRFLGRYRVIAASFALVGLASIAAAFLGNVVFVLVVLWSLGSTIFLTFPGVFSFASESSRRHVQGAAFGLVFFVQLAGGAAASFLAGTLGQYFIAVGTLQFTIPLIVAAAFAFGGCLYLGLMKKRLNAYPLRVGTA